MNITPDFNRRIRIEGKLDETRGYILTVRDVETGEMMNNVRAVTLWLHVETDNTAEVIYYKKDEQGKLSIDKWGNPIQAVITLDNPEVAVTAYEVPAEEGKET